MKQFKLSVDVLYNLERWGDDLSPSELASMSASELGTLIHMNEKHGSALKSAAMQFPSAKLTYTLRPLGSELLKISTKVDADFEWNSKVHGGGETFWLWVEDSEEVEIFQCAHLQFRPITTTLDVDFVVPIRDPRPPYLTIRFLSDSWLGAEDEMPVSLDNLVMPSPSLTRTPLLDIPFLPVTALHHPALETLYERRFLVFNGIQTQCFWSAYNSSQHMVIAAPASCGKSIIGHLTIW
jgi:antiviral helicase SLH1